MMGCGMVLLRTGMRTGLELKWRKAIIAHMTHGGVYAQQWAWSK
jgi:hypothetical protein